MKHIIELDIQAQPDDQTCGPSCLYSLYRHFGDTELSLKQVIDQIEKLDHGGTLHRGARASPRTPPRLRRHHLQLPRPAPRPYLVRRRRRRSRRRRRRRSPQAAAPGQGRGDARFKLATKTLIDFLELGGDLRMEDLTPALLSRYIAAGSPILTGLSSTYLYGQAREFGADHGPTTSPANPRATS